MIVAKRPRFFNFFKKLLNQTGTHRLLSQASRCDGDYIERFISENTEIVVGRSLTPELRLRLFTPACRFWKENPELWPFSDPYWAIYWPGGQALSRFLLDNPDVCRGRTVLDLGSGCGAAAIAAKLCGAAHVEANDIDPGASLDVAAVATRMNSDLNGVAPPVCVTKNLLSADPGYFDVILLGDMFYDESLTNSLHSWLDRCIQTHNTKVLIGDPGRAQFEGHQVQKLLCQMAQFDLPPCVQEENYGLTSSSVWHYRPKLT